MMSAPSNENGSRYAQRLRQPIGILADWRSARFNVDNLARREPGHARELGSRALSKAARRGQWTYASAYCLAEQHLELASHLGHACSLVC
jgi:hypothetical protein